MKMWNLLFRKYGAIVAILDEGLEDADTLQLIRWRRDELPHPGNLVLISKSNAMKVLTEENAPVDAKIPQPHELALEKAHCVTPEQKNSPSKKTHRESYFAPRKCVCHPQCFDQALLDKSSRDCSGPIMSLGNLRHSSGWRVKTAASWHGVRES